VKNCNKCQISKPLSEFSRRADSKDGYRNQCQQCLNSIKALWKRNNPEVCRTYNTTWRKNNPQKVLKSSMRCHYKKEYGITFEQKDIMVAKQNNRCRICCKSFKLPRDIHVDHSHTTKKVRGILCSNCNTGLGKFQDNITFLKAAIKYLKESDAN